MKSFLLLTLWLLANLGQVVQADHVDTFPREVVQHHDAAMDGAVFGNHPASLATTQNQKNNLRSSTSNNNRQLQQARPPPVRMDEIIAQTLVLQLLEAYVVYSGIINEIQGPGPMAMFMPWDQGWERLDPLWQGRLQTSDWRAHLQNLLRYHMYDSGLPLDSIGETQVITMANSETVQVDRRPGTNRIRVNDILVIADVYEATNG